MESRASGARDLAARAIAIAEAEARLAKFRSLVRNLDVTPREKRVYARDIANLDPEQQALVLAKINRERRDGDGGGEAFHRRLIEVKQRLSQEVRAIEEELTINRISGTNDASTREAEARNEELLAKRDAARDLALLNPEEMVRKFSRRNRARRAAIRAGQRQRRRAADEARANEKRMERARKIFADGIAARSSGGLDSPEAGQEVLRVRRADVRALPDLDSRRLATEVARLSRARRFAIPLDLRKRNREHATDAANAPGERKKLRMDGEAAITGGAGASGDVDSTERRQEPGMDGTGTSSMPDFAEARQDELPPTREHAPSRALAETNHRIEIKQEPPWRDGEVHAEKALMDGKGIGFLGSAEARKEEVPLNGEHAHARALAETEHPLEVNVGVSWTDEAVRVEEPSMDCVGTGDLGSAEARQKELPSNGEHANSRTLAETDHPREIKQEAPWRDGEVLVENALMNGEGTGFLGSAEARQEELLSNGEHAHARALSETGHPLEVKVKVSWTDEAGRVEEPSMDGVGTGDQGSAEARQEELPSNGEHAYARALAATDHPPESAGGNGGVGFEKALADGVGTGEVGKNAAIAEGAGAGGFAFAEARLEELRAKAVAEVAGRVAANAVRHPDGRILGVWTGEVGRNAAMGGAGAGRFALTEARLEELRTSAIATVAEKVVRDGELKARAGALVAGAERGRVSRNEAVVEGTGTDGLAFIEARLEKLRAKAVAEMAGRVVRNNEVQPGVGALANGVGTGEVDHHSAVVGGTGARGFPFVAANIEGFRTQAVAEAPGGVTWDAAEVNRDAGLAQDRHSEELRTCGQAIVDGIGTDEVDGNAAVVDGTGAGGFPFLEPKHEQLGTEAVAEIAGRVARDAAEVQRKADLAQARQADGQAHMGGIGTGETGRKAEVVAGAGAGGFSFLEPRLEELRTRAVELVERPGRSERDAVTEEGGGVAAQEYVQREVYAEAVSRLRRDLRGIGSSR